MRVLLVDHGEGQMFTLAGQLALHGYITDTVEGWARAVERVHKKPYDAALVVDTCGLGGVSILRLIHRLRPHMPVLLFSGDDLTLDDAPTSEEWLMGEDVTELMDAVRDALPALSA